MRWGPGRQRWAISASGNACGPRPQGCSQTMVPPHPYRGSQASPEHSGRRLSLRPGCRPAARRFLWSTSRPGARRGRPETLGGTARRRHARPGGETKAGCVRPRVRKAGAGGATPAPRPLFAARGHTRPGRVHPARTCLRCPPVLAALGR